MGRGEGDLNWFLEDWGDGGWVFGNGRGWSLGNADRALHAQLSVCCIASLST